MTDDMRRLCEAAKDEAPDHVLDGHGRIAHFSDADAERIVRAVLTELLNPSEYAVYAMGEALRRPRQHLGHKDSDDVRTALIGHQAILEHILQGD